MGELMKRVPILNGANEWEIFKIRIQSLLVEKDYYILDIASNTFIPNPDFEIKCASFIKLFIGNGPLFHVKDLYQPALIFEKLRSLYEPIGPTYDFLLLNTLFSTTLANSSNLEEYILKIKKVSDDLKSRDIVLPEKALIGWVLFNLTPDFDFVISSINQTLRQGEALSLDRIFSQLLDESRRLNINNQPIYPLTQDTEMSMATSQQNRPRKSYSRNTTRHSSSQASSSSTRQPSSTNRNQLVCGYCKKQGHSIDTCFTKQNRSHNQLNKGKNASAAYLAQDQDLESNLDSQSGGEIDENEQEEEEITLISLKEEEIILLARSTSIPVDWVLDSGATSHFCANKDLFLDLKPCSVPIAWGKAKKLIAKARGTVRTSFRGKKIRLENVLYLPQLGVNLLSTSRLVKKGYKVELGKSVFIRKGNFLLVQGQYRNNLVIISSTIDNNSTKNTRRGS